MILNTHFAGRWLQIGVKVKINVHGSSMLWSWWLCRRGPQWTGFVFHLDWSRDCASSGFWFLPYHPL